MNLCIRLGFLPHFASAIGPVPARVPKYDALYAKSAAARDHRESRMSDINIFSDPLSIAILYFIFGGPGLVLGVMIGALAWRAHRIWGALLGAVVGYGVCLAGVWAWIVH